MASEAQTFKVELRKKENGPLQFKKDNETELNLVKFIKENAKKGDLKDVIKNTTQYCYENHWMMNLGYEKGKIYQDELRKCKSGIGLELGCYMGYSCLLALYAMGDNFEDSKMVCVDPNSTTNKLAQEVFDYAGVTDRVKIFEGILSDFCGQMELLNICFHHVFLDHKKEAYYDDLLLLEKHNIIRSGTMLFADNVVIFNINNYLDYVNESDKYERQKLYKTNLEYTDECEDGVHVSYFK